MMVVNREATDDPTLTAIALTNAKAATAVTAPVEEIAKVRSTTFERATLPTIAMEQKTPAPRASATDAAMPARDTMPADRTATADDVTESTDVRTVVASFETLPVASTARIAAMAFVLATAAEDEIEATFPGSFERFAAVDVADDRARIAVSNLELFVDADATADLEIARVRDRAAPAATATCFDDAFALAMVAVTAIGTNFRNARDAIAAIEVAEEISARLTAGETAAMLVAATMREAKAHLPPAGSVVGDGDVSHPAARAGDARVPDGEDHMRARAGRDDLSDLQRQR